MNDIDRLDQFLRLHAQAADCMRDGHRGLHYAGPSDFVLQHGIEYDISTATAVIGAPRACYGNSMAQSIMLDALYVEGYALTPGGMPVQHAWIELPDGRMREVTWGTLGRAYRGVVFSIERADDCMWNGDATVLDDYQRGWPLLREEWHGEDFSKAWPVSPRLEILRAAKRYNQMQ